MSAMRVGDTVYYCADRFWQQFKNIPLILHQRRNGRWICRKPDGRLTTDLEPRELSRSPVDTPVEFPRRKPKEGRWLLEGLPKKEYLESLGLPPMRLKPLQEGEYLENNDED